jgi:pimeloyl-ACP methyl ester carboxylesterase
MTTEAGVPGWLAAMLPPGVRRAMVDVGDGQAMSLFEGGPTEGPAVVMLHGNPTWGFLYRKVVAALEGTGLRLVVPDLVGLGFSTKPREAAAHTLAAHARWFGAMLDQVAPGPVLFVGQDWGGPIGMRALADRPGRLAGLVVLNTVLSPPRPGFRPTAFHRFARAPIVSDVAFRLLGFPQNVVRFAQGDRASMRGDVARAYTYPLRRLRDRAAPLALARMVPDSASHPSIPELARVQELTAAFTGPAAIVWGDRDPVLGSVRNWISKLLPAAPVTRTDAGHFLQEEVPQPIAAAIHNVATQLRWC